MKNAIRLSEEISKNVTTRKFVTTKIEYFCESEDDTKTLTDNITRVLTKNLGDTIHYPLKATRPLWRVSLSLKKIKYKVCVALPYA